MMATNNNLQPQEPTPTSLSNEAALNYLEQAIRLLQTLVNAKDAILVAVQADQVRVNLEKGNADMQAQSATLQQQWEADRDQAAASLKALQDELAATAAQGEKEHLARVKAHEQEIAALEAAKEDASQQLVEVVQQGKKTLADLQEQIEAAKGQLAQAKEDYAALKAKFQD
jgi:chromosome segregation ATPase